MVPTSGSEPPGRQANGQGDIGGTTPPPTSPPANHSNGFRVDHQELHEVELGEVASAKEAHVQISGMGEHGEEEGALLLDSSRQRAPATMPAGSSRGAASLDPKDWVDFFKNWTWDLEPFHGPYGMHLAMSVVINAALCLLVLVFFFRSLAVPTCTPSYALSQIHGTWAVPAVTEAVAAFEVDCSGHGDVWADSPSDTKGLCECHQCYVGPTCSTLQEDCEIDASAGNPLLFRDFWRTNAKKASVLIPGNYRIGYTLNGQQSILASRSLEDAIRRMHTQVGNAVVDGRHIVIGVGSSLLLNAALFALSEPNSTDRYGNSVVVTAAAPYYQAYAVNANFFRSMLFRWGGPTDSVIVQQAHSTLEFITSPNNPDGSIRLESVATPSAQKVYDLAYYWPHFTPITEPADHDVMIFTLSKATGHAGTRVGWAIVKKAEDAQRMQEAVETLVVAVSHEAQLRAAEILRAVSDNIDQLKGRRPPLPNNGVVQSAKLAAQGHMFSFAAALMQDRWQRLHGIFSRVAGSRFSLQQLGGADYCNYFKATKPPSPAYAWIKCNSLVGKTCLDVFKAFKITGRAGSVYGAGDDYVRLSLLMAQSTFDALADRLPQVLAQG